MGHSFQPLSTHGIPAVQSSDGTLPLEKVAHGIPAVPLEGERPREPLCASVALCENGHKIKRP